MLNVRDGGTDTYSIHGRPMRPLPKRPLRSRLSEGEATTLFTPTPEKARRHEPVFRFPYPAYADYVHDDGSISYSGAASSSVDLGIATSTGTEDLFDDDDKAASDYSNSQEKGSEQEVGLDASNGTPTEGYDWSENTNNKKKRKIPGSNGGSCAGGSGALAVTTSPGFSPNGPSMTPRSRWKASAAGQRSPLQAISNQRRVPRRQAVPARKLFQTPERTADKENEPLGSPIPEGFFKPKEARFSFECPSRIQCPPPPPPLHTLPPANYPKNMTNAGTQTLPEMGDYAAYSPNDSNQPAPTKKKGPRGTRTRPRRPTNYLRDNSTTTTINGEPWICEFCEYESIFGEAPEALMRQYDIKDRRERRKAADRQRLLEKVKQQRGKKNGNAKSTGKKGRNNSTDTNATHANGNYGHNLPPPPPPPSSTDSQGTQSEDGLLEGDGCPDYNHHSHGHVCDHSNPTPGHIAPPSSPVNVNRTGRARRGTAGAGGGGTK